MDTQVPAALNNTHPQWWKDPGLRKLNLLLAGCMLGSVGFGYDASLINGLLSNSRWFSELGLKGSTMEGIMTAAQSFGAIAALMPAAYLSDLIGRRQTILISNIAIIAAAIGQSFSHTVSAFLGTRLVIGFFEICVLVSTNALVSELSHPRQRAQVTALGNTFFYIGGITAAWTSFGSYFITSSWTWRLPVLMQCCWPVGQNIVVAFMPESPRWYLTQGCHAKAKEIFIKYHANGVLNDELAEIEYRKAEISVEAEEQGASYNWLALFSNIGNIKRSILTIFLGLSSQWVGNGIVSYYLSPILEAVGVGSASQQLAINGGLQIFNWVMAIPGALLAERLGRVRLLLISACGMLIFMVLVTASSAVYEADGNKRAGQAVIAFLFCFFGSYDLGYTPIPPLYVTEIASTHLRAKYISLYWMSTAVALCFNQFVNPIAFDAIHWHYYIVYIGVLCPVIVVLVFHAPETKGRTLEEVAWIFDRGIADSRVRGNGDAGADADPKPEVVVEQREYA
ncbi:hexose transporter [Aspergillus sclerotioniger CBS 115572]|uniref:Hexose transporter n=1 Tax=Aspergillus sclerotioniger CBS 115572 TaxID=1450535 RepID=A0A317W5I6_9EURO|nr:hexose transporter [Aspergillus sclerotioniger CBS 115572]PWY80308.1 hexose transporter [Aspergillus sclerotioniger CBS 115572]